MSEFDGVPYEDDEQQDHEWEELSEEYRVEEEEFNAAKDKFFQTYGFEHDCRCAEDWEEGNFGVVSMCYLGMCSDALDKLEVLMKELAHERTSNAQMRITLVENGINPDA